MPDFGNFIKVIQVGGGGGGPFMVATDTPIAGQTTITDTGSGNAFVIPAPTAEITGQFAGTATTFAGLPVVNALGDAVSNGDFAILTADDGLNVSGIYAYNGAAYVFAVEIADTFQTVIPATPADVTAGTVVADSYVQADTLKAELDKKANTTVVADAAAITALEGTLSAADEGKNFAYQSDTDTLYIFDGAAFIETGSSDNLATANLTAPNETRFHTFDQSLQFIGDGQKSILSDDGTGRQTYMSINNGVGSFENRNTNGANDSIARYEGRALPASAYSRITATDPNTDITSKFETTGENLFIYTPATDGGTAEVDQVLVLKNAATGQVEYEHSGKALLFIDETTLAPAIAGEPTLAEVTTFVGTEKDRFAFYTSTDTSTDDVLSIYYADKAGAVIQVEKVQEEGLRGSPVADNADLTALPARDNEHRKVSADGKEYVFELGALTGTLADDATTGFWQEQITSGLVTTYIDSSAGATIETLAASTAAGVVRLFTTEDVTNSASLAVDTGETLNGVVDGAFLFSNYAAGTQFRADEVAGGWVVSVSGASTDAESIASEMDLTDITATGTVLILGTNPANGTGTALHDDGTATVTRIGDKAICTLRLTMDDDSTVSLIMGTSIVPTGGKILSASINGFHRWENASATVVSDGNTITIDRSASIDADLSIELTFITDGWEEKNQQVLAGMVTPTNPGNYSIRGVLDSYDFTAGINVLPISQCISSDAFSGATLALYENDSQSWRSTDTLTVPIGYGGLYNAKIGIVHTDNELSNVGGETQNTSGMELVGLKINGVDQWLSVDDATGLPDYFNFNGEVPLSEGDTIELISNGGVTANEDLYLTLEFSQKPTSTVVMPDALDVVDNEVVLDSGTISSGGTLTLPADISAYEYIRFEVEDAGGNDASVEGRCKATAISDCRIAMHHDDASGYVYFDTDIAGTTATLTATVGFAGSMTARAIGVKAQKTVINTVDAPVVDWTDAGTFALSASMTAPTKPTTHNERAIYKVVGKSLFMKWSLSFSDDVGAANGTGSYLLTIPAGYTINTALTGIGASGNVPNDFDALRLGKVTNHDQGVDDGGEGYLVAANSNQLFMVVSKNGIFAEWASTNLGMLFGGPGVSIEVEIPIN